MSAKAISEATGKRLLNQHLDCAAAAPCKFATVTDLSQWNDVLAQNPWIQNEALVVKPDQLIKRRGKLGLIHINGDAKSVHNWIAERINRTIKVERAEGALKNFIIEPFLKHSEDQEAYVCIYSTRDSDVIMFYKQGGVHVGDVDAKAHKMEVPVFLQEEAPDVRAEIAVNLLFDLDDAKKALLTEFIQKLYSTYVSLYFTYLEINPLVITNGKMHILDLAAKLDATADYICKARWGNVDFPPPFGRDATPEEAYIHDLDSKSGASLKLTVLNPKGELQDIVLLTEKLSLIKLSFFLSVL